MPQIVDWTPGDYSPTYRIEVYDDDLSFRRLVAVFDVPPHVGEAQEIDKTLGRMAYAERSWNDGWQRKAMLNNKHE